MPDQRIVFFARSNWLLKLHFQEFFWISRANFPQFSEKRRNYLVLAIHWFGIKYSPRCR